MPFTQTPLHRTIHREVPLRLKLAVLIAAGLAPVSSFTASESDPYEKEFVITAYYSPIPGQCCYVKGGLIADRILNGQGVAGADGTGVFPGMVAAPSSYAFGTTVQLPGIGTFRVHDRGGAITELENGADRLDLWVGHGEEGLARALAFGVQRVRGTVYPNGSNQPQVNVDLEQLPSPPERLSTYMVEDSLLSLTPKVGDRSYSTSLLQQSLQKLGYFSHAVTGLFGTVTQQSLAAFITDYQVGSDSMSLTERTGAYLTAALKRITAGGPISGFVDNGSAESTNKEAQRTLRYLGYYKGRTDGAYSEELRTAIFHFQQDHGLVGTVADPGAGRIGPITQSALERVWNRKLVAKKAENYLAMKRIEHMLAERGQHIDRFLAEGNNGAQVRVLQTLLAERGFFPAEEVNGNFGSLTKEAVLNYQLARGIVKSRTEKGAGGVGPETLRTLRSEEQMLLYRLVRGEGWRVL